MNRKELETDPVTPWNVCVWVSSQTHDSDSKLSKLMKELNNYAAAGDEIKKHQADLSETYQTLQGLIPDKKSCWLSDFKTVNELNAKTLPGIGELTHIATEILEGQLQTLKDAADSRFKDPLGSYQELTIERILWVEQEKARLENLEGPGSSSALREIEDLKQFLDHRMFDDLTPRFLSWHIQVAQSSLDQFKKDYMNWEKLLLKKIPSNNKANDLTGALQVMKDHHSELSIDVANVLAEYRKTLSHFRLAMFSLGVVPDYCKFVGPVGSRVTKILQVCQSDSVKTLATEINRISDQTIKPWLEFSNWAAANLGVGGNWVQDMTHHIDEWIRRTDIFSTKGPTP